MKNVMPPTYSPLSLVTVHVYKGMKINWLLKLHKLSREAKIAKRAPEKKANINKNNNINIQSTENLIYGDSRIPSFKSLKARQTYSGLLIELHWNLIGETLWKISLGLKYLGPVVQSLIKLILP